MRTYYIRRTAERGFVCRYEISHGDNSFDGYALTKLGAKIRAMKFIFEDFIKEI